MTNKQKQAIKKHEEITGFGLSVDDIIGTVRNLQDQIKSWESDLNHLGHKFHSRVLDSVSARIKNKIKLANTAIIALCQLQIEISAK